MTDRIDQYWQELHQIQTTGGPDMDAKIRAALARMCDEASAPLARDSEDTLEKLNQFLKDQDHPVVWRNVEAALGAVKTLMKDDVQRIADANKKTVLFGDRLDRLKERMSEWLRKNGCTPGVVAGTPEAALVDVLVTFEQLQKRLDDYSKSWTFWEGTAKKHSAEVDYYQQQLVDAHALLGRVTHQLSERWDTVNLTKYFPTDNLSRMRTLNNPSGKEIVAPCE